MGWIRIKHILVGILLLANLFLGFSLFSIQNESRYISADAIESVSRLLAENHIFVAEDAVDRKIVNIPILSGELYSESYTQIAVSMSDSTVERSFNTPGGLMVTLENGDRWTFSDDMQIAYTAAAASPIGDETLEALSPCAEKSAKKTQNTVLAFLNRIESVGKKLSHTVSDMNWKLRILGTNDGIIYCTAAQYLQNTPLHHFSVIFAVQNDTVIGMKGYLCFAYPTQTISSQLLDQVNILYTVKTKIAEDRPDAAAVSIQTLSLCYTIYYHTSSNSFYLIPAWQVTLSDGYIYTINAINGEFYT